MNNHKNAILLMNVGSPDRPNKISVYRYLTQFLNDKRVIDLPLLGRLILVNLIIIPFRIKKSTKLYKRLFDKNGSPLIYHSENLKVKLQKELGDKFEVFLGMRYGNPGYKEAIQIIKSNGFKRIIILPLFPQHAMSTTETAFVAAMNEIKRQKVDAEIIKIGQFYNHPRFIQAFVKQIQKHKPDQFDHILFSYHGLPNRQIEKGHPGITVDTCDCKTSIPDHGKLCYRATCFATSRLIARELGLKRSDYTDAFQSRLSKNWLSPFSDDVILEKLKQGNKKILVIAPAFVTDCLETVTEIGEDYKKLFTDNGGDDLQLVESLNDSENWVNAIKEIITSSLKQYLNNS